MTPRRIVTDLMRSLPRYMRDTPDGKAALERFAAAVAQECARICEAGIIGTDRRFADGCRSCAALIRAELG